MLVDRRTPALDISQIEPDRFYSDPEFQAIFGVNRFTSHKYRTDRRNPLEYYKLAGRVQYRGDDIIRWVERCRVSSKPRRARASRASSA